MLPCLGNLMIYIYTFGVAVETPYLLPTKLDFVLGFLILVNQFTFPSVDRCYVLHGLPCILPKIQIVISFLLRVDYHLLSHLVQVQAYR